MGFPHLITFLEPYAVREGLARRASCVVIDGPGFAYHVYHIYLNANPGVCNPLAAIPTYKELGDAAIAWLDGLRKTGVVV